MNDSPVNVLYKRIEDHRDAVRADTTPMDNSWANRRTYKRGKYRATTEALLQWTLNK